MIERNVSVAMIFNKKGEILLQKKSLDYMFCLGGPWCFFGGGIKNSETPEKTIKREIKKELGISLNKYELIKTQAYNVENRFKGKAYFFKAEFKGKISDIILTEGAGFAFFDLSEIDSIKIEPTNKKFLREYFNLDN